VKIPFGESTCNKSAPLSLAETTIGMQSVTMSAEVKQPCSACFTGVFKWRGSQPYGRRTSASLLAHVFGRFNSDQQSTNKHVYLHLEA
jgi:hypothetical protein